MQSGGLPGPVTLADFHWIYYPLEVTAVGGPDRSATLSLPCRDQLRTRKSSLCQLFTFIIKAFLIWISLAVSYQLNFFFGKLILKYYQEMATFAARTGEIRNTELVVCPHQHACDHLNEQPPEYQSAPYCNSCRHPIHVEGGFYHCRKCKFDLCKRCGAMAKHRHTVSELDDTVNVALPVTFCKKKHHEMKIRFARPIEYTGDPVCDHCRGSFDTHSGFRHCKACGFDLCPTCCHLREYTTPPARRDDCLIQ